MTIQQYIALYNTRLMKAFHDMDMEGIEADSHVWVSSEGGFTNNEVVGYYLHTYHSMAAYMWLKNLSTVSISARDMEITELFFKI